MQFEGVDFFHSLFKSPVPSDASQLSSKLHLEEPGHISFEVTHISLSCFMGYSSCSITTIANGCSGHPGWLRGGRAQGEAKGVDKTRIL